MEFHGCNLINNWNQNIASQKAGYPNGMCILFAFHFGARRMLHMNHDLAIQETMQLEKVKGNLLIKTFHDIYQTYQAGYGNFSDEVLNIARQYESYQIADSLHFQVLDYDQFDIFHEANYENKGLHNIVVEDILYHYYEKLHSNSFLMIGIKTKNGNIHALSLLITSEDKIIIFDPNYGWYFIENMFTFFNDYGKLAQVIEWNLVIVKQE